MNIHGAIARTAGKISVEAMQIEAPRADEILVRLVATGLCHTDISALEAVLPIPFPMVLGHEGAGIVEKVGSDVKSVKVGDHVVMTYDHCGHCPSCESHAHTYCHELLTINFGGNRATEHPHFRRTERRSTEDFSVSPRSQRLRSATNVMS